MLVGEQEQAEGKEFVNKTREEDAVAGRMTAIQ